jgi:hypothetical protein
MATKACTVSFKGPSGVRHSVDLEAETVFEAAIRGVHLLKKDGWVDKLGPGTELEVLVREPPTRHAVTMAQLRKWCEAIAPSPVETIRKAKLKMLLE